MKKPRHFVLLAFVVVLSAAAWGAIGRRVPDLDHAAPISRAPAIHPDYAGIVLPPNIAPLNFAIREPGSRFFVRLQGDVGEPVEIVSPSSKITIPQGRWRSLLLANRGASLRIEVYAQADGHWRRYQPIVNSVAEEEIGSFLAYRRIGPVHRKWTSVGVYQRELGAYRESVVLDGMSFETGCVNCHSFAANDPNRMLIGIRSPKYGNAAILSADGRLEKIGAKFGYTAWHPSGRLAAYSINNVWQFFHASGAEVRDVIDIDGALAYRRLDADKTDLVPGAAEKKRLESYPAWSPDGRFLYYCSAPTPWTDLKEMPPKEYANVRYDLMRVSYDPDQDQWGEPETVLSAEETGLSVLQPRISPDGRFLLFCMCRYGCFPVYQPSSDLYMMTLATGEYAPLEINSEFSESWHSWSSNSRWIAFSSRRDTGGFLTRCYLSYVDDSGRAHKAFVLPQEDPEFYDSFLETISVPELIDGPIPVTGKALTRVVKDESVAVDGITGATNPVGNGELWQPARE